MFGWRQRFCKLYYDGISFCTVKFLFASIFLPTTNFIEVLSRFFLFRAEKMTFKQSHYEGEEENIRLVEL